MMTVRGGVLLMAAALPLAASAQEASGYRCVNGELVRRIEVAYVTGAAVPCEVRYHKDTEAPGGTETPWRANSEAGFCEARAEELVSRLRGWGWECVAAAPAATADDTDALAAGSEADE